MLGQGAAEQGKGGPAISDQTLPQHSRRPAVQRQKTLLQRVVGKRISHAATRRFSPIKHDADYAGGAPSALPVKQMPWSTTSICYAAVGVQHGTRPPRGG